MTDAPPRNFIDLTADIVSAYLSNNPTPAAEIPGLISQIHAALVRVSSGRTDAPLGSVSGAGCAPPASR